MKEEKELLLKYLCASLPYDTIVNVDNGKYREDMKLRPYHIAAFNNWDIKPYLRPMSSMTKNEKRELQNILSNNKHGVYLKHDEEWEIIVDSYYPYIPLEGFTNGFNWLNKKKFDYQGLIPMGLALSAPEGMYN